MVGVMNDPTPILSGPSLEWPRRDVLQAGAVGVSASVLAGLGLESSHAQDDLSAPAKSVIYLWIGGGMTHIDSFDPKPEAPEEIRGEFGTIGTKLPGVRINELLPGFDRAYSALIGPDRP